jgi:hypothetical protein
VGLALGRVAVDVDWPLVRTRFARGELDADAWRPRRADRDARAPAHLDAARFLAADIQAMRELMRSGEILCAVEEKVGELT